MKKTTKTTEVIRVVARKVADKKKPAVKKPAVKKSPVSADVKNVREVWLNKAVKELSPFFVKEGKTPTAIKVSCGFPFGSKKAIGQCWQSSASEGKFFEIFISPTQSKARDVLAILIHEMIHAVLPANAGHGKEFKQLALGLGLAGKMTATVPGDDFDARYGKVLERLGDYPHAKLKATKLIGGKKKDGTRLLKASCDCGVVIRITKTYTDRMPICSCCKTKFKLAE